MKGKEERNANEHNDRFASCHGTGGARLRRPSRNHSGTPPFDYIKAELERSRAADDVYRYLIGQSGWLPGDFVFDREEANAR